jgi:hypothetical protein
LTKTELAELCGVPPTHVDGLVRDKTLPPTSYLRVGGALHFSPIAVAVILLVLELERLCGSSASLPKRFTREIFPRLQAAWHDPQHRGPIVGAFDGAEISIPAGFVERAKTLASAAPR